jgi:hypothetical protein
MKTISLVFVAALSFATAGCKKAGGDCTKAIDHSMELSKAEMQKMPGMDEKVFQKMRDIGVQHCKDDKWPEDALKCMTDAKSITDAQACYGKLSPEQRDKMNNAAMEAVPAPGGAGTGSAGSAAAAPGSDTGSAAAGSATGGGSGGSAG